ncbi:MAG: hypothetical protein LAT67_05700 [Balneolales bacterium]|nr:hypothetical protein [Balneolales bacterium]
MDKPNKEFADRIISDIAYLNDEIYGLKQLIDVVPATEKSKGILSILDMISLIEYAQQSFYRPAAEQIFAENKPVIAFTDFEETFTPDIENKPEGIKAVLSSLNESRTSFVKFLGQIEPIDFSRTGTINGVETELYQVLEHMISFERKKFREIAERILTLENTDRNKKQ